MFEIEGEHHSRADVLGRTGDRGAAGDEAVGGGVNRDGGQQVVQDGALPCLQLPFGCLQQPGPAGPGQPPIAVVRDPVAAGPARATRHVGQGVELVEGKAEMIGQIAGVMQHGWETAGGPSGSGC